MMKTCKITGQDCYHLLEGECDYWIVMKRKCPIEKLETSAADVAEAVYEYARRKLKVINEES